MEQMSHALVLSLLFSLVGIGVFGLAFFVMTKLTPFSIRKEIEDDQNTALGIIIGAVLIGLSIIIAASIHG
jgi:putative membrane protein